MKVTPDIAEAMYNCLKAMKPFSRWHLPDSDSVEFHVHALKGEMGSHLHNSDTHRIRLSQRHVQDFETLAITMGHELIHVKQFMDGKPRDHGKLFTHYAEQICEEMVWHMKDLK